jgi:hypothetical protein
MPYPHLDLQCADRRVAAVISMFAENPLKEAHNLLCGFFPIANGIGHFGKAAAVMTLLSVAATSRVRYFDVKKNKLLEEFNGVKLGDKKVFKECVERFFPWDDVGITDSLYVAMGSTRPSSELREEAANVLYTEMRNPLVHSGGVVAKKFPVVKIVNPAPGLGSFEANDAHLCEWCNYSTLKKQEVLRFDQF